MRSDGVDRSTSRDASSLASVAQWAKDEWPTVATAVHGLASAPGIVADAWRDAAKTNTALAEKMSHAASSPESRAAAKAFASAAAAQTAKASSALARISGAIGTTVGAALGKPGTAAAVAKAVGAVPGLKETPVLGLAIAGAGAATDVASKKASVADAVVANAGAALAGTVVGSAVTPALTSAFAGAAGADVGAEALGVAVAAGPVGWAVAGGVIVGAAAGYGVYRAIESAPGQHVIDGIAHLDGKEIQSGFAEAGGDVTSFGTNVLRHIVNP
jgi:hypothetical protein